MKCRLAILVALALAVQGGRGRADEPTAEGRVLRDLKFLAGDACEGRGITTKGIELAADYVAQQFRQAGLKPGGTDGTYFQPFRLTTGAKLGKGNRLVLAGPQGQSIVLETDKHFDVPLLSTSGKVEAPLVFVGYGLTAEKPKYDDYAGLDVAGKVVVVLGGTPRQGHRYADEFAEAAEGRFSPLTGARSKIENAIKHKAAAVLLVNRPPTGRFPASGAGGRPRRVSVRDGDPYAVPVGDLRREWLDRMLVAATGRDLVETERAIDRGLTPHSAVLGGWGCRMETDVSHTRITVKNVVGVAEGSGPLSKETVVIGAHYDHVGMGSGGGPLSPLASRALAGPGAPGGVGFPLAEMARSAIHHGADDNASGTAALLELARRTGAQKDRSGRRVVFIAFTAEESGLLGSAYYCKNPVFPLADTAAMINMDMVGRLQDNKLVVGGLGSSKALAPLIHRLNEKYKFELVGEEPGGGASDHASFYAKKVPVVNFFTGFHEMYHRPTDRFETINVAGVGRLVDLVVELTAELRRMPEKPAFAETRARFNRTGTLWASAPSVGIVPDYRDGKGGVLVEAVIDNTPAAKAGLKKGDRLLAAAGKPIKDPAAYHDLTRAWPVGNKVELTIERGDKKETVALQLARPTRSSFADSRFGFVPDSEAGFENGVRVREVPKDSAAEKAGLKAGDRITAVDGNKIDDAQSYFTAARDLEAGTKVPLTVVRDGKELTLSIEVQRSQRRRPGGSPE